MTISHACRCAAPSRPPRRAGETLAGGASHVRGETVEAGGPAGGVLRLRVFVGDLYVLVPGTRLVQAWRASTWDDGVYSVVRFGLTPADDKTKVVLDHAGYPDGAGEHLEAGWQPNYWEPLTRRFP